MYTVLIDTDVPISDFTPTYEDLGERIAAAMATLGDLNAEVRPTKDDQNTARAIFTGAKLPTPADLSSSGVILQVAALLSEYDKVVVKSAAQLRIYVTNRLILESDSPDARIRMRALELLGKISDVGLFTDKTEITMRHRPTEELEQMLRERLTRVVDASTFNPPDLGHMPPPLPISDVVGR